MASDLPSAVVLAGALLIVVNTLAVSMRLWVRYHILHSLGPDDALISMSWLGSMLMYITTIIAATKFGLGEHIADVPPKHLVTFSQLNIASSSSYSWSVPFAKASFAVLYLRILQGSKLAMVNRFIVIFLLCQAIEETAIVIFHCTPVAKAWESTLEGKCMSLEPMWWCTFVFNLGTDLILFIQPIPTMWRLQLPVAKRVALIVMMSLGLLVCVISVIRIVNAMQIGTDSTYELAIPLIWSMVEITALILCSCIPSLRQVVQQVPWLNHLLGLSSKGSGRTYYGQSGSKGRRYHQSNTGQGGSIALHSRNRNGNFRSSVAGGSSAQRSHNRSKPFGMRSHAERGDSDEVNDHGHGRMPSKSDSTDEIIPFRPAAAHVDVGKGNGGSSGGITGIIVTHDIKHDVEVRTDAQTMFTDTSSRDDDLDERDGRMRRS